MITASWKRTTLGAICDEVGGVIKTGPFGAQLHESDYVDEGVPVVMPKDIIEGKVRVATIARIGHEDVERLSQHKLKAGDIVYGRRGDIGRQALITRREQGWLCGTGCLRISLGDKVVDPTFLHYYLRDEKVICDIANQAVGATMPNLNTTILRSIKIRHPDLPTQRKIAGSRTIQAVLVPRAQLDFACTRSELKNVGLYLLFGDTSGGNLPLLYIGEAEDCASRLKQHNKLKDWWGVALVCISKTAEFTKAHVKYLEWYCHQQAEVAGRYKLENGNVPPKSHVSESVVADLMDHFESIRTLTSTLGYPLFDLIQQPKTKDRLVCKGKKAQAAGEYTEDGLIVFAGSIANRVFTKSSHDYVEATRDGLIKDGVMEVIDEDTLRFVKDHVFNSPSQAAAIVLARNANGWLEWKYPDGKTLDEVKRKNLD